MYLNILNDRLTQYLKNKILDDEQNGFWKLRSYEDHMCVLSPVINCRKVEGKSTFAAFVDISKAFDCINCDMLYYKLLTNNINENFYYVAFAVYRDICVQLNYLNTNRFETMQGVMQGDNLSPYYLVFTLMILQLN